MTQDVDVEVVAAAAGVVAGHPPINFAAHQVRTGGFGGAREDFEQMISQLVRAARPGARMIAANPGDWGIDVLVGELGGSVVIWQSKYFFPSVVKSHQEEIRKSFRSARANAATQGYQLRQWVLCVPSSMDPPTAKWWDNWKKREQRLQQVVIELWDETELRNLLISPDAEHVRRHYYESPQAASPTPPPGPPVAVLTPDAADKLDRALFVRQLREAGHVEVMAAKREFFNADLMAREIVDKGVPAEVAALTSADAVVHSVWENRFNDACQEHDGIRLPGLHTTVMKDIRTQHVNFASGLPGGVIHSCGLMHRVVDDRRAGWVRHWREIAAWDEPQENRTGSSGCPAAKQSADDEGTENGEPTTAALMNPERARSPHTADTSASERHQ